MDNTFGFFKAYMVVIIMLIAGGIAFKVSMVMDARKNNKTLYEIEVNNYRNVETYTTTEYTRDQTTGCIRFKDEFGIKHTVCNNYTITEY